MLTGSMGAPEYCARTRMPFCATWAGPCDPSTTNPAPFALRNAVMSALRALTPPFPGEPRKIV
ncbi:MAG: hypothetical protein WAW37_04795 [Syntrophobacteraceae bacterium]